MRLIPASLVGRTAVLVTLMMIMNQTLWFGVVRPVFFESGEPIVNVFHLETASSLYRNLTWAVFSLVLGTLSAYAIFFWLRRQLAVVVAAARVLGRGETPPLLAESGPQEICYLSRGFNQLALNLGALDRERRLMIAGISHDLRTPLTRLRLALELMEAGVGAGRSLGVTRDIEEMILDIEEMDAILMQFLDYAREGRDEEPVAIDFDHLVADVCRRSGASGVAINTDSTRLSPVQLRPLAIRRMVSNLMENAVRYAGKDIEVSTHRLDGKIVLTVQDRGPGIRGGDPNRLIQPFARENTARSNHTGAGLGLSIVDRIAKAHGGHLHLMNREGGGLIAVVTLPIDAYDPSAS